MSGASRGLGRELALLLCREGGAVWLVARDVAALEAVRRECVSLGASRATVVVADASRRDFADTVWRAVSSEPQLDLLVLNHAVVRYQLLAEQSIASLEESYLDAFEVNAMGAIRLLHRALPALDRARGGRAIVIGTLGAVFAQAGMGAYVSSKAALMTFAEALQVEQRLLGRNASITLVHLGEVGTEQLLSQLDSSPQASLVFPQLHISPRRAAELILCGAARGLDHAFVPPAAAYALSWLGVLSSPWRAHITTLGFLSQRPELNARVVKLADNPGRHFQPERQRLSDDE